jgi:pilus assembly protein Flp/PilA
MFEVIRHSVKTVFADRRGISAIEYGILGAVVVVAIVAIGPAIGDIVTGVFATISSKTGGV